MEHFDAHRTFAPHFLYRYNLYESLVRYDADLNPEPLLAEGFEISAANDAVTVNIRSGVTFHNGEELTASDVVASYEKARNPDTGFEMASLLAPVREVVADDDSTVTISFEQPIASQLITDMLHSVVIYPESAIGSIQTDPVGTGPFQFVSWDSGIEWSMERYDGYWGEPAASDSVTVRIFSDEDAMTNALRTGDIDIVHNASPVQVEAVQDDPNIVAVAPPLGDNVLQVIMNTRREPFSSKAVRQAMQWAIDGQAVADGIYTGLGAPAYLPWSVASPGTQAGPPDPYSFDMDRATQLVDGAGVDGSAVEVLVIDFLPDFVSFGEYLKSQLQPLGLNLELELIANVAEIIDRINAGEYDIMINNTGGSSLYPMSIGSREPMLIPTDNWSFDNDSDIARRYSEVHAAAVAAVTDDEVTQAFEALNEFLLDESWVVHPAYKPTTHLMSSDVTGHAFTPDNNWILVESAA